MVYQTLAEVFDQFIELSVKVQHLLLEDQQLVFQPILNTLSPNKWLSSLFQDYWYQDNQDGRVTRNYYGVILANEQQYTVFQELNNCKMQFKHCITELKGTQEENAKNIHQHLAKRHPQYKTVLERNGLARLLLKHCYRLFPLFSHCPTQINYSWYLSGRSIQRITVKDARNALKKLNVESSHIQLQLQSLVNYPEKSFLAKVQTQAPLLRANLRFDAKHSPTPKNRQALNTALPIICLAPKTNKRLPTLKPPKTERAMGKRQRAIRSDQLIEAAPFLPSIRVHRYLKT